MDDLTRLITKVINPFRIHTGLIVNLKFQFGPRDPYYSSLNVWRDKIELEFPDIWIDNKMLRWEIAYSIDYWKPELVENPTVHKYHLNASARVFGRTVFKHFEELRDDDKLTPHIAAKITAWLDDVGPYNNAWTAAFRAFEQQSHD